MRYLIVLAGGLFFLASCSGPKKVVSQAQAVEARTASGFSYVHHIRNEGPRPEAGQYAIFHVIMTQGDTVLFDSDKQPQKPIVQIPEQGKIQLKPSPILEGLALMSIGDSLSLQYPVDSTVMTYHLALKSILNSDQHKQELVTRQKSVDSEERAALRKKEHRAILDTRFHWKQYKTRQIDYLLVENPSGLKYVPLEEGSGKTPETGQLVKVHYYGILMDGAEFANTYDKGREMSFQVGKNQTAPGLEEAALQLKKGGKAILFIPWELGYGEKGINNLVPPYSDLVIYLELMELLE
jgi:FKBP-type peptidyl-prolyl cis-trans isomerase